MCHREKYQTNGVCWYADIERRIEENTLPSIPIEPVAGIEGWNMKLQVSTDEDGRYISPVIYNLNKPKLGCRFFFSFITNQDLDPVENGIILESDKGQFGQEIRDNEAIAIANEDKKYKRLWIEYGFHVDSILSSNNIWTFNFENPMFESREKSNQFVIYNRHSVMKRFYCHKQLLKFHSPFFVAASESKKTFILADESQELFQDVFQMAHGVFNPDFVSTFTEVLECAHHYQLSHVTRLIDRLLIQMDVDILLDKIFQYGLTHRFADILRNKGFCEELKKEENIEMMSGEMMKQCIKLVFDSKK